MLTTIATWLSVILNLPAIYDRPRVEFVSSETMHAVRYQGRRSADSVRAPIRAGHQVARPDHVPEVAWAPRAQQLHFSRDELLISTRAMSRTYLTLLRGEPVEARRQVGVALRIERVFTHVLQQAKQLRPAAEDWDWQLVLVASEAVPPIAMPDGQIFVPTKWVSRLGLTDAEIALLLAHEMAHVVADHMLERVSAFATARPTTKLTVSDVLRWVQEEWPLARELEPLMQAQELEADRIGMVIVCAAGVARSRALTFFDKMARAEGKGDSSYLRSHADPLQRKASLMNWMQAHDLVCLD